MPQIDQTHKIAHIFMTRYTILRRDSGRLVEIIASEIVKSVLAKLASEAMKRYVRSQGIHSEAKKLERTLFQIQNLLTDASQKEIADRAVKEWLNNLQHLAYDIDDILDDLATEAMHRDFTEESGTMTSKVRKFTPTCCTNIALDDRMRHKLDKITNMLQDLKKEKKLLGLTVKEERPKIMNRKFQSSLVDVSSIVGRQGEKDMLVRKLLGDEKTFNQKFSVVPIVGMGGVGKTTLASLLYDDEEVKDHFKLKAWVCVSNEFDIFSITKVIFQSVGGENKEEFANLNLLQVALRDKLRGKRFLLVVDDVWSESYSDWETLVGPFHTCSSGSKIIMTTRKEQLVKKLCYDNLNHLESLSHDDALCLFAQNALGVNNFDLHSKLKPYGEGIVRRCDGLPLALIALGRLLRTKKVEEEYWKEVLNSEIWMLQDGCDILPALRLSYHDLSAHLKWLFAYCSLFPKDFVFDKEQLVLLWMAEGFLDQSSPSKSTAERLGHKYFDELLSRSFFQHALDKKSFFVMHDLLNDLATSVAGDFFISLLENEMDNDIKKEMLARYRHMSFVRAKYQPYKKFEAFKRAKSLRTFLATTVGVEESWPRFYLSNKILVDILPELTILRVLCLSGYVISEVPESIGKLKHLRYLNLSQTKITQLPETVGNLLNLQTLILFGCHDLMKLPKSFIKLKNLRHFDIRDTPLLNMIPSGIGELKRLQTLSMIIIGNGFELTELKGLKNLCGEISIKRLDKVKEAVHARELNFLQKSISVLEVEWTDVFDGSRQVTLEKEVLNELKPCNDSLKQLKIVSYGGIELPNWIGDPSYLHLKHMSMRGCKNCLSLPPLGQLDSLKELFIEGLDRVKCVGSELLGTSILFCSLEILSFEDMPGWEEWSTNGGDVFPSLKELTINDCPNLDVISLEKLPTLRVLNVRKCGHGVLKSLLCIASSVTKLKIGSISGLSDEVWGGVIEYLGAVEELSISGCNEMRYLWESQAKASMVLVNLRNLEVNFCNKLVSLAGKKEGEDNSKMTSLRRLHIWSCESMECCRCPNNIETLDIMFCDSMTTISFPEGGGRQKLKTLQIIGCEKLLEKEFIGGQSSSGVINGTMLENVMICDWVNMKSIIELNCYLHLTCLTIMNCSSLESFPEHQLSNLTSLIDLGIIKCPGMDTSFPSSGLVWPPKLQRLELSGSKKPISEWGPQNFPTSLVHLTLYGSLEEDVIDISQLSNVLPSSLTYLNINGFKKLERVSSGLQHLTSLQHLVIKKCPKVMDLPEMLFPSLLSLQILICPKLKERCSRKRGRESSYYYYWPRISHIPHISIIC